jgi:Phytanoyl-CoA dioxygenase (PhyH)
VTRGEIPAELREEWREEGWCVWQSALPEGDLKATERALDRMFPTAGEMDSGLDDERTSRWRQWDAQWPEFPFRSRSLNKIALHPMLLDLAENLLETEDVRLYMGLITAKYANQSSHFNQLLHADYPNHMIVVPRREAGYRQLETFVYLTGVTTENGATRMVSVKKTAGIPVERHTLNLDEYADLYEEPGEATGPPGTVVCYRPDVYHRSIDWEEPGRRRIMMHLSFRPPGAEWGGYQAWPYKGLSPDWHNFVVGSNPRELGALGFPKPGHVYWTSETLSGVGARYPGLDMKPWWEVFESSESSG